MKAYKKSKLTYENGYIMKGNDVVAVDPTIVSQLNYIEEQYQKALFDGTRELATQSIAAIMDKEFELESERETLEFVVDTPHLDKAAKKTMKIMDEIDNCNHAAEANKFFKRINTTIQFVTSDKVIDTNADHVAQFDLPNLGNPLELDADKLMDFVNVIFS